MEAKRSQSSNRLPERPKQSDSFQETSRSHESLSQSSQTYTNALSSTGNGASGQSLTATTANFDPDTYQAALDYQQISSPDHSQDLYHTGSWATIEPFNETFEQNFLLSPNYRAADATNAMDGENDFASPMAEGEGTKAEAVELLRASLHR